MLGQLPYCTMPYTWGGLGWGARANILLHVCDNVCPQFKILFHSHRPCKCMLGGVHQQSIN